MKGNLMSKEAQEKDLARDHTSDDSAPRPKTMPDIPFGWLYYGYCISNGIFY